MLTYEQKFAALQRVIKKNAGDIFIEEAFVQFPWTTSSGDKHKKILAQKVFIQKLLKKEMAKLVSDNKEVVKWVNSMV